MRTGRILCTHLDFADFAYAELFRLIALEYTSAPVRTLTRNVKPMSCPQKECLLVRTSSDALRQPTSANENEAKLQLGRVALTAERWRCLHVLRVFLSSHRIVAGVGAALISLTVDCLATDSGAYVLRGNMRCSLTLQPVATRFDHRRGGNLPQMCFQPKYEGILRCDGLLADVEAFET